MAIPALKRSIAIRQLKPGMVQHSDRESQNASYEYRRILEAHKILPAMSGKGNFYANVMLETVFIFKTIELELIWCTVFQTRNAPIKVIGEYIDGFSNPVRKYFALGYKSPNQFETVYRKLVPEAFH